MNQAPLFMLDRGMKKKHPHSWSCTSLGKDKCILHDLLDNWLGATWYNSQTSKTSDVLGHCRSMKMVVSPLGG